MVGIQGWRDVEVNMMRSTYEWKSATIALSPSGMGMYSWPAPLMMVRGTYF